MPNFPAIFVAFLCNKNTLSIPHTAATMRGMEMKFPVKKEKLSERCAFLIPQSTKKLQQEAESKLGLDFPTWARGLIHSELERLLSERKN